MFRLMKHLPRDNPKTLLGVTPFGDIGVFANEIIFRGEHVASFDGPVFSWPKTTDSISNEPPFFARDHAIQFEELRARDSNGLARFTNHSCSPNAGIRNLFSIVAMRDIEAGEEVTWDYDMSEDTYWSMKCRCKSEECRELIAGYRFLPPAKRRLYGEFVSEWLLNPARPYLGPAKELYETYRFPVVPRGRPFRHEVEDSEVRDDIMVITPEMMAEHIRVQEGPRKKVYEPGVKN